MNYDSATPYFATNKKWFYYNPDIFSYYGCLLTEEGKKKKVLVKYEYDLGSCMFCELCVKSCPHGAIKFAPTFENAVFTRSKLVKQLN